MRFPILLSAAMVSGTAVAAPPNPFDDYEAAKRGDPPAAVKPASVAPAPKEPPPIVRDLAVDQWSALLGGRGSFSFTTVSNDTFQGDESNRTFFFRLTPSFLLYPIDRLELGISTGVLGKSLSRENDQSSLEFAWLTEASVGYAVPLGTKAAFIPNLGLGFYLGSNDRDLVLPGSSVRTEESTDVAGFSGSLGLDIAFQPLKNFQLRSGLGLFLTVGSETVDSKSTSLSSSAFHIGVPIAGYYVF